MNGLTLSKTLQVPVCFIKYCQCFLPSLLFSCAYQLPNLAVMGSSSCILYFMVPNCATWVLQGFREPTCRRVLESKKFFCLQFVFIEPDCMFMAKLWRRKMTSLGTSLLPGCQTWHICSAFWGSFTMAVLINSEFPEVRTPCWGSAPPDTY